MYTYIHIYIYIHRHHQFLSISQVVLAAVSESGLALEHASCELRSLPIVDLANSPLLDPFGLALDVTYSILQKGSKGMVLRLVVCISIFIHIYPYLSIFISFYHPQSSGRRLISSPELEISSIIILIIYDILIDLFDFISSIYNQIDRLWIIDYGK